MEVNQLKEQSHKVKKEHEIELKVRLHSIIKICHFKIFFITLYRGLVHFNWKYVANCSPIVFFV